MTFDISRNTFDPWKDVQGVVVEQGRVQSDADWNEGLAATLRRIQAGTLDTFGGSVVPSTTPAAFQITAVTSGGANSVTIGVGRMYVDGILAENHGLPVNAVWDRALAELSGAPQPAPATGGTIDYRQQPWWPNPDVSLLAGNGPLLAYLDVWTRPLTFLQDADLVDPAIAVDTAGRLQTVWQVRLMDASGSGGGGPISCATPDDSVFPKPSAGRLTSGTVPNAPSGPCCLSDATGYTGVENQLYRVEIHKAGTGASPPTMAGATFKWSRENGSVRTAVTAITAGMNTLNLPASVLTVTSLGRDQVLGFLPGQWIELTDEAHQLGGRPGELYQIDQVDASSRTITLTTTTSANFPAGVALPGANCTRIIRWDQSGKVYQSDLTTVWWDLDAAGGDGSIPVPPPGTTLVLESGITVAFDVDPSPASSGQFGACDFWSFAARTATAQVAPLVKAPPEGPHHHYAKLAVVSFNPSSNPDCRTIWPPTAATCGCCAVTVGDGTTSQGQYTSIQAAINALPAAGGEVRILAGHYFEDVLIQDRRDLVIAGCGMQTRLSSAAAKTGGPAANGSGRTGLAAVVTVIGSQHVELRDFCVEAATDEVGVLLDEAAFLAAQQAATKPRVAGAPSAGTYTQGNVDVAMLEIDVVASTLPGIAAFQSAVLRIEGCRVGMVDVQAQWPAIYVSGQEMRIERNWVGIAGTGPASQWLPAGLAGDTAAQVKRAQQARLANAHAAPSPSATGLAAAQRSAYLAPIALTPGGIQVAGGSSNVHVVDNLVEGGSGNGITLGSTTLVDGQGNVPDRPPGIGVVPPDPCKTDGDLGLPPTTRIGGRSFDVLAAPPLHDIRIERNRIHGMGLCGIGPVGFFDLAVYTEVVTVERLSILGNFIQSTMRSAVTSTPGAFNDIGYGAIALPDVLGLRILDNVVTDFGATPGAALVCGIFVLNVEQAVIGRNQVQETRDWNQDAMQDPATGRPRRGGIVIHHATPASFAADPSLVGFKQAIFTPGNNAGATVAGTTGLAAPVFEPTLPALVVQDNLVRSALGPALDAAGSGAFQVTSNHFASGGTVGTAQKDIAATVKIVNSGLSLELAALLGLFGGLWRETAVSAPSRVDASTAASSDGGVLFADNACHLETRASGHRAAASVIVFSLDHVGFSNNRCWIDGQILSCAFDVFVLGMTAQVCGNRMQESLGAVLFSGVTFGLYNVTSSNVSTVCLIAQGVVKLAYSDNLDWMPAGFCEGLQGKIALSR